MLQFKDILPICLSPLLAACKHFPPGSHLFPRVLAILLESNKDGSPRRMLYSSDQPVPGWCLRISDLLDMNCTEPLQITTYSEVI